MMNRKTTMRKKWVSPLALSAGLLLAAVSVTVPTAPVFAAGNNTGKEVQKIVYTPFKPGATKRRIGGATRGTDDASASVAVLAPEFTGLSHAKSPALYWYVSKDVQAATEIVVIDPDAIDPVVEIKLEGKVKKGIQHLDLSSLDVALKPGVEYAWSVALVQDESQRSMDIISTGSVMHRPADASLAQSLDAKPADEKAKIFAANGYWYDAVKILEAEIQNTPNAAAMRELRDALLQQVDLAEVVKPD